MKTNWESGMNYGFSVIRMMMWIVGVWPLQWDDMVCTFRWIVIFIVEVLMIVVPCFEMYLGCTDAETSIDCLMLICCGILGVLKIVWFRMYARNLANNYCSAMKDYLTTENIKERAIMRKHAFMGRTLCCLILGFSYFSDIMYGLIAILDEYKHVNITKDTMLEYPVPSKCFMKFLNAPVSVHKIFCLINVIALMLASNTNHGNDALFLNITLHVCGQVKILRANFLNFDIRGPHIYNRFQLILQLNENNVVLITKNLMVQSAFLTQLTLYSVIGDYLKSEMEEIGLSIYRSTWYNFPVKLTRLVVFIIMRLTSIYEANHQSLASSLMVILPSIELYTDCNNAEQNVDSLMLLCCGILGILKTVWFRIYARNLTNNYSSALNDYLMIKNAKHRAIMRKHASTGRILCCFLMCFSYFSNDSMFFNITLHMCGQVEVLKAKFIDFDVTRPQVYKRFIMLIKRHSYLIRLARELANTISFILLIQLSILSLQLCIVGFQLILALKNSDTAMAVKSIMVQSTFLSQLTLYSFIGDYLKSQMEEVGLCVYQNNWYDFPTKLTRNLAFIIMRSESPVTLKAGHFIVVNLSTYMSILKASITYLSVLRVMVET
ncbi:Putative odorant receptor 9a [Cyphomyrmex costatus]|uniref:Putative odorant receptor 9a n=1 Tax=Cyphomyrmex costatus TaxID=456900 RepID=A0A151IGS2_9HYME|nr:Putative odorant receptor 9a [Cyphomyrmex costatus]